MLNAKELKKQSRRGKKKYGKKESQNVCFEFSVFHFLAYVSSLLPDKVSLKKKKNNQNPKPSFQN